MVHIVHLNVHDVAHEVLCGAPANPQLVLATERNTAADDTETPSYDDIVEAVYLMDAVSGAITGYGVNLETGELTQL